jgi:hypothetical protein
MTATSAALYDAGLPTFPLASTSSSAQQWWQNIDYFKPDLISSVLA